MMAETSPLESRINVETKFAKIYSKHLREIQSIPNSSLPLRRYRSV
jgi:hypothetical protein